jgi:YkoY family integral membrane protein
MAPQTFVIGDIPAIFLLVILEALLSADNALVLAIMVRHLDSAKQKRALSTGLAMSFVFRFAAILVATQVMRLWWLQTVGGLYLVFLLAKHVFSSRGHAEKSVKERSSYGATIVALAVTDVAFAVDSVLAAVAIVKQSDKVWVVIMGALIGIIALRFAAGAFIKLLERYPSLDHMAYALVGWAGVKLIVESGHTFEELNPGALPFHVPKMEPLVFWSGMGVILLSGILFAVLKPKKSDPTT